MNQPSQRRNCPRCGEVLSSELGNVCDKCLAVSLLFPAEEPSPEYERVLRRLGDYELLEKLARGGMGVVFRARQVSLDREVAVKVLHSSQATDTEVIVRFHREATTVARLDHPNIVPVFEVGEADGQYFLSMALVHGPSLAEVTRHGSLEPRRAATLMAAIAGAVQHAHERGILHRDLKPGNVLVDDEDNPRVTDFGLAQSFDREASLTVEGQVLGTPAYMAPEQALGLARIGPSADVYSLGALLFHLLTGRPPFVGGTVPELLRHVAEQEPVSPRLLNPDVPLDLAIVCLKCLEKDPSRRYSSAEALAADLGRWLANEPIQARPSSRGERVAKWIRRKPGLAAAIAVAVVTAIAGLAGILWQWQRAQKAARAAKEQLWEAQRLETRALRTSGEPGQRSESLAVIGRAVAHRPSTELRNEAIGALALMDLHELRNWRLPQADLIDQLIPPKYAVAPNDGRVAMWWYHGPHQSVVRIFPAGSNGDPLVLDNDGCAGDEVLFSPDGRWLAVAYFQGQEIVVWDASTAAVRWRKSVPRGSDFSMDWTRDGRHLAVCTSDAGVRLFDLEGQTELPSILPQAQGPLFRARFNPRHPWIAVTMNNELTIWNWRTRALVARETFDSGMWSAMDWHPDGERIAVSCWMQPEIYICKVYPETPRSSARPRRILRDAGGPVFLLAFNPEGTVLAVRHRDSFTRLWDVAAERIVLKTARGLASGFSQDGSRLFFDRETAGVGTWEVAGNGNIYRTLRADGSAGFLGEAGFDAEGRHLAWGQSGATVLADLESGSARVLGWEGASLARFNLQDGSLLTAGDDGIHRWRGPIRESLAQGITFRGLAQTPDGKHLAAVDETNLWIFGDAARSFPFTDLLQGCSVALSPDAKWAAVGTSGREGLVIDLGSGVVTHRFKGHRASVAFNPAGRWLATGTPQEYNIWSLADWKPVRHWQRESASAQFAPLAVTSDGALLAVTLTPRVISLLATGTGEELAQLHAPSPLFISALTFSRDGAQLAASSENGTMQIWQLTKLRRELRRLGLDWEDSTAINVP